MENNSGLKTIKQPNTHCASNTRMPGKLFKPPSTYSMTIHHGAKHPAIVRHQPPLLSGGRKGALHFRVTKYRVWGHETLHDDIRTHLPVPFTLWHQLYIQTIAPLPWYHQPEAGAYSEAAGGIRQVCRKHSWKEEIQFDQTLEEYDW